MCKKGILISIILTLTLTLMFPFSISANGSLSAPFIGFNVHITGFDAEYNKIKFDNITVDSSTDTYYVNVAGQLNCSNPSSAAVSQYACDVYELENQSGNQTGWTFTLKNTDYKINGVTANLSNQYQSFLYEIECVLDDAYVGWVQLSSGEFSDTVYVNGTSFSFSQLTTSASSFSVSISDYSLSRNTYGNWAFPIESFGAVTYAIKNLNLTSYYNIGNYVYPMFSVESGDNLFDIFLASSSNQWVDFIFYADVNDLNLGFLNIDSRFNLVSSNYISLIGSGRIYKVRLNNTTGSNVSAIITAKRSFNFIPIFQVRSYDNLLNYLSTDFALNFGYSNRLLDDLNIIAQGTTSSNQSANNLDSSSNSMNSQMNNLVGIEDGYNQQFNNSLNQIDFTSPTGNQNLLSSANFVITVFNGLIQNNFLSTLIIIICILIIGKKVIGK